MAECGAGDCGGFTRHRTGKHVPEEGVDQAEDVIKVVVDEDILLRHVHEVTAPDRMYTAGVDLMILQWTWDTRDLVGELHLPSEWDHGRQGAVVVVSD